MKCVRCKKLPATVHLTRIADGLLQRFDYCEECARPTLSQFETLQALVTRRSETSERAPTPEEIWPGLTEKEYQALAFIGACLEQAVSRSKGSGPHVSAADILFVAGGVARRIYGPYARAELLKMGVDSSLSLGNLIFDFIRKGILSRTATERVEDFHISSEFDDFLKTG